MKFIKTIIPDLYIIEPSVFGDDRGYFFESWSDESFAKNGLDLDFVQDNQSFSSKGVLRGLHFQNPPFAQGKLVRVIKGAVLDIGREALLVTATIAGPMLLVALVIGLLIGIVQAATSINEMTLSFIPKLACLVLVLYLFGSWQITVLTDFASRLIERIPGIVG